MSFLLSSGLRSTIPDSGIARYEFEQDTTDSWNDNDLVDNTSAGYTAGEIGDAKVLDGGDDYLTAPYQFDPSDDFTLIGWINLNSYNTSTDVDYFAAQRDDYSTMDFALYHNYADSVWRLGLGESLSSLYDMGVSISTGTPTHIALTKSGDTYTFYKNGVQEFTTTDSVTWTTSDSLYYGSVNSGSESIDGWLDHIDAYSKGLSSTEVQNHYQTGSINQSAPSLSEVDVFSNYTIDSASTQRNMVTDGGNLYFVTNDLLHSWDVSSPESPVELDTVPLSSGCGIAITSDGSTIFVADGWTSADGSNDAVKSFDVSDPSNITQLDTVNNANLYAGHGVGLSPDENTLLVAAYYSDELVSVDVSDSSNISVSSSVTIGGVHDVDIGPNNNWAYISAHEGVNNADPPRVYSVDMSDPANISIVDSIDYGFNGSGIRLSDSNDYVFAAIGTTSPDLVTIDVTDPTALTEVNVETGADPYRLRVYGDDLYYAASYSNGEQLVGWYDVSDPANPDLYDASDGYSLEVEKHATTDYLYSANQNEGVRIIEVNR